MKLRRTWDILRMRLRSLARRRIASKKISTGNCASISNGNWKRTSPRACRPPKPAAPRSASWAA
jgi:hypothetical protein